MTMTIEVNDTNLETIRQELATSAVVAAEKHIIPALRGILNFDGEVQVTADVKITLTSDGEHGTVHNTVSYGLVFPQTYDAFEIAQQLLFRATFERVITRN